MVKPAFDIAVGGIGAAGRDYTPTFNVGLYGIVVGGIGEAGRDYTRRYSKPVQHAV